MLVQKAIHQSDVTEPVPVPSLFISNMDIEPQDGVVKFLGYIRRNDENRLVNEIVLTEPEARLLHAKLGQFFSG